MNLPNKLTISRVLMIPVFLVFFLLKEQIPWGKYAAAALFVIASCTDFLDGRIARKQHLVTNFGKFMDPLADKLLVCSALICFVYFRLMPVWAVIVIVAREFIISGFRLVAAEKGVVLAASRLAKVKTACQMIMTVVLILSLPGGFFSVLSAVLIYASLILTVLSLAEYLYQNRHLMDGEI